MKHRTWWMIGLAGLVTGAILVIAFSAAQPETQKETVTLEEIYALLITVDGQNRLEEIQETFSHIHEKIDLIYLQAKEMMEEEGWQFEKQEWTLDDIKFLLDDVDRKVNYIWTAHGGT